MMKPKTVEQKTVERKTIERKATIFNIQKYNMYDGPGVRTLVFFQGCPLRCQWCANPEGLERRPRLLFKEAACVSCGACVAACPQGIHRLNGQGQHEVLRDLERSCTGCGACVAACPQKALSVVGEEKTISELLAVIQEDQAFYSVSGGGVTLSGGEVLMQPEAAANLLMACKREGIHTAIETCGYAKTEQLLKVAQFVDLFLFDIKHFDSKRHAQLTGVHNELIKKNLETLLQKRYHVKIRMPLLKGINDSREEIEQVVSFLLPYRNRKHFHGVDLLPYHKLGVNKYQQLGKAYPLAGDPSLSDEELDQIERWINGYEIPVAVIRH